MARKMKKDFLPRSKKGPGPLVQALHGEAGSGMRKPGMPRVSTGMMHNFINKKRGGM
jgi:hypothetical protein